MLDRDKFRAWLQIKKPTAVVGFAGRACKCPLATYLTTILPEGSDTRLVSVGINSYLTSCLYLTASTSQTNSTPRWAQEFITAIDKNHRVNAEITAATALYVLDGIVRTFNMVGYNQDDRSR